MSYTVTRTWDGRDVDHPPARVQLSAHPSGLHVQVSAPFFSSPPTPAAPPGKPCPSLWDYEVVEVFFLNDKDQYVEVELCPDFLRQYAAVRKPDVQDCYFLKHGQHLVLLLNGRRQIVQEQLELEFSSEISGNRWRGDAVVPISYLPPDVTRFNVFAIHGEGEGRVYEALYPATEPHDAPDFHRLQYFGDINLRTISPALVTSQLSDLWSKYPPAVTS